jgi:gluconate 2-dehydrogenase alpha chain
MTVQDWGVTWAEMEPYHDLFERLFGIAGKAGNINGAIQPGGNPFEGPRSREYPQRPLEITEAGRIFKAAAESLGYKPFPMPAGNSPDAYTNPDGQRLAPCQYCGHCERFLCEANAKASPQVLLYPVLLKRKGFELRLRSHVLNVNYDRRAKRVTGVRYLDLQTGQEYEQPADVVVVAAYSMTSTRLLLQDRIGEPYDPASAPRACSARISATRSCRTRRRSTRTPGSTRSWPRARRRRSSTSSTATTSTTPGSASSAVATFTPT